MAPSTKRQLLSGIFYSAIAKYSGLIISLFIAGVLGRMVSSTDFGIIAVASVIISFFSLFTDLGIAPALVQKQDLDENDYSSLFSFSLWSGLLLSLLFWGLSWWIADFYGNPTLLPICQLLSVNLLFASFNIVPNALLYKNKQFKFIAFRTLITQVVAGCIAIYAAYQGAGVYALLINPILSSIVLFVLSYLHYPIRPSATWGIGSIRKIWSFSTYQFLFSLINYFSRNLDKLLIGRYFNMQQLGFYEKSYRLMMLPLQNITQVISPVMHPIFADFQHDFQRLISSYERLLAPIALVAFPLTAVIYFTSEELMLLIFGNQWTASVEALQLLSLSVGFQIILSTSGSLFQAANSTKSLFVTGVITTIINIAALLIGLLLLRTIDGVAMMLTFSFTINYFVTFTILYRKVFKSSMTQFVSLHFTPFVIALLIALGLWTTDTFFDSSLILQLIVKGGVAAFIFFLMGKWMGCFKLLFQLR